jgi:hypothetical protein
MVGIIQAKVQPDAQGTGDKDPCYRPRLHLDIRNENVNKIWRQQRKRSKKRLRKS